MNIVVNLAPLIEFFSLPLDIMIWKMILLFGWIPIAFVFLWGVKEVWVFYIQVQWAGKQKKILLAIDIPRGNEQSAKAVENLFSYIGGAHKPPNLVEKYWVGEFEQSISFEIVSIEGYTQYIIHTPEVFRNLVETAIYSQYPDAEIYEVDDYTKNVPQRYPDDEWDIYGFEVVYVKNSAYPIKTYQEFEHNLGKPETHYKDTMAALMDLCSSLRRGEQLWYQIIVKPGTVSWAEIGDREFNKIIGKKEPPTGVDVLTKGLLKILHDFSEAVYELWGDIKDSDEEETTFNMMQLSPKQKIQIEAIQKKTDKQGFATKQRFVYVARKDVMNKPKVGYGFIGYIKQFNYQDLNALKPDFDYTGISAHYMFRQSRLRKRKNNLISNYSGRDGWAGTLPNYLNTEELATLWHFPHEGVVKAPLIQKAPGRKAEPPMALPVSDELPNIIEADPIFRESLTESFTSSKVRTEKPRMSESEKELAREIEEKPKNEPPSNLPIV